MTIKKSTSIIIFLILTLCPLISESYNAESPAEKLEVKIAVIGAADPLYSWWGHVGFIIENTESGAARYYDYGNFSFEQDSFLKNFIMGKMDYMKIASDPELQLKYNSYLNRNITLYTLNAKDSDVLELYKLLENDILPENMYYRYNLFFDNCATRIRDRIDILTDGEFSPKYKSLPSKTLREQIRRSLYSNIAADWLLNFALSGVTDREATEWDGMFLPIELGKNLETMTVLNSKGERIPFVKNKEIINIAKGRAEILDAPPPNWYFGLIAGLLIAAASFFLKGPYRTVLSLIISLIFALLGTLLFFMAFFTDHNYTYGNMNLFFINPFLFVTFGFSIRKLSQKSVKTNGLRICWMITSAGAVMSIILKIIPACRQDNWESILLLLPVAIIFSLPEKKKKL